MRVAQIVFTLEIGGLERVALDLCAEAKKSGHESILVATSRDGPVGAEAEGAGIPVIRFGKAPGLSVKTLSKLAACLRRNRIDVVHTHNSLIHHYGALAGRLARVPVVVNTEHGMGSSSTDPRQFLVFRSVLPITDRVCFVSTATRDQFCADHRVPLRKAEVMVNGIQLERFLRVQAAPGAQRPRVRFGALGRMVPIKDHSTLLRAFSEVHRHFPAAELHLCGYGPLELELRQLTGSLGLTGAVTFHDGRSDIPCFLANLDILVFSSLSEGLPLSLIEGMATGLPVVSTRVGGIPEVAPDSVAWYSPPGRPEVLAEAMLAAASDDRLAERGAEARKIALRDYSAQAMFERYRRLYEELMEKKSRNHHA